ncbi:MAG TPA: hypothetical protein VH877_26195 [Polyangia bacterium]|jgi:hypothetical protein|nr:hypothetical protein [Polyangia bacterium]
MREDVIGHGDVLTSQKLQEQTQEFLTRFDQNPRAAMAEKPAKFDDSGHPIDAPTGFSTPDIASGNYVLERDSLRKRFRTLVNGVLISLENILPGRAPIENNDRPENLVDTLRYAKLADIESANLRAAALAETPWSDDYWALYTGCVAKRYADPGFPMSENWQTNFDYVRQHSLDAVLRSGDATAIDQLSPAEKYDLLVGSTTGALTQAMWNEGKWYQDRSGKVETWMGICHGWAPAAYMLPRPRKAVTVLAADGKTQLRFYPADIKALASLLWANAHTVARFVGGRSNDKNPATDSIGRPTSPAVFDNNPGTWHLSVVNQIGVAKRSFVMDATYDYEVWNQPIYAYRYTYFNPQSMRAVNTLQEATVARAQFTKDRFRRYRSPQAALVTGISMYVQYIAETEPSHDTTNAPSEDRVVTVRYMYDLEQNAQGGILGGEWYTGTRHPDFLWTPPPGARALTPADSVATGTWPQGQPVPQAWRAAALRVADRSLPLAKIVEELVRLANA